MVILRPAHISDSEPAVSAPFLIFLFRAFEAVHPGHAVLVDQAQFGFVLSMLAAVRRFAQRRQLGERMRQSRKLILKIE
jgi:hypothetical protein